MIIDKGDHRFIHPWGVPIFHSTLTVDELKFFQDQAETARRAKVSEERSLAGNIKEQYIGVKGRYRDQRIVDILSPHIINYIKYELSRLSDLNSFVKPKYRKPVQSLDSIRFDLGGPWFNFMKKGEFNPLHAHNGVISGILMIKVPEEIDNEDELYSIDTNLRCPGYVEWVCNDGSHQVRPKEGDIYLFDARLRHLVYPFQSDVERITSSFNVFTNA